MRSVIILAVLLGMVSVFAQTPPTEEGLVVPAQTSTMGAAAQSEYELRKAASERLLQQDEITLYRKVRYNTIKIVLRPKPMPKTGSFSLFGLYARDPCYSGTLDATFYVNEIGYLTVITPAKSELMAGCVGSRININPITGKAGWFTYDTRTKVQAKDSIWLYLDKDKSPQH